MYMNPVSQQPFKQLLLIPDFEYFVKSPFKCRSISIRILFCLKNIPIIPSFYMTLESFKVRAALKKSRCAHRIFSACQQCILNQIVILIPHKYILIGPKQKKRSLWQTVTLTEDLYSRHKPLGIIAIYTAYIILSSNCLNLLFHCQFTPGFVFSIRHSDGSRWRVLTSTSCSPPSNWGTKTRLFFPKHQPWAQWTTLLRAEETRPPSPGMVLVMARHKHSDMNLPAGSVRC